MKTDKTGQTHRSAPTELTASISSSPSCPPVRRVERVCFSKMSGKGGQGGFRAVGHSGADRNPDHHIITFRQVRSCSFGEATSLRSLMLWGLPDLFFCGFFIYIFRRLVGAYSMGPVVLPNGERDPRVTRRKRRVNRSGLRSCSPLVFRRSGSRSDRRGSDGH